MPNLGRYETVDLPGVGKVPGKSLLGGALVLLALLILVAISRNASAAKARAERRRKFRTLTDYGRNEMEFDAPKSAEVNYVNPMVAAAGGALAGAAVATAVNHHDDHGHHDAHGHEDTAPSKPRPMTITATIMAMGTTTTTSPRSPAPRPWRSAVTTMPTPTPPILTPITGSRPRSRPRRARSP
jgi:Na+-transporting methylmalonyl-CoA/oxaloacetate decarboxylase gamma subunit